VTETRSRLDLAAYDFAEQQDILSSDKEETAVDIGIEVLGEETFDCVLENEVS
jgi:hypothetical protein